MAIALELLSFRLAPDYSSDFQGAVAVVAASFNSYRPGRLPDESNEAIACATQKICHKTALPFFAMWEQADLIDASDVQGFCFPAIGTKHITTHAFMRWVAQQVCAREENNKVILVGHPHHMRRVAILARYYGLNPVVADECRAIPYARRHEGEQFWCVSPPRYIGWEYACRVMLLLMWLLRRL